MPDGVQSPAIETKYFCMYLIFEKVVPLKSLALKNLTCRTPTFSRI